MKNYNLSSKSNSVSAHFIANKDYIADSTTREEAISRIKEALSDCPAKKVEEVLKKVSREKTLTGILTYVWNIILKGDNAGSIDNEISGKYKKW